MSSRDDRSDRYDRDRGDRYDRDRPDRSERLPYSDRPDRPDHADRGARGGRDGPDERKPDISRDRYADRARTRSRSPRREDRSHYRDRERERDRDRGDVPFKRESDRDDASSGGPNGPSGYNASYGGGGGRGGGPGGPGGRGGFQGRVGFAGRGGYRGGPPGPAGGGGYRREDFENQRERDRPLDRKAIEEGRRRREEERARGIVLEDPSSEASITLHGGRQGLKLMIVERERGDVKEEPKDHGEEDEEEDPMAAMMGFGGFGTTKVGHTLKASKRIALTLRENQLDSKKKVQSKCTKSELGDST
jgi:U4/U6.U5 tri-snRNP-associated protein 3